MTNILALLKGAFGLITVIFKEKIEKDKRKRAKRKEIKEEMKDAISNKDVSRINATIGRIKRLR